MWFAAGKGKSVAALVFSDVDSERFAVTLGFFDQSVSAHSDDECRWLGFALLFLSRLMPLVDRLRLFSKYTTLLQFDQISAVDQFLRLNRFGARIALGYFIQGGLQR